jgi:hypothetical protein
MYDYFAAESDRRAADALELPGGPGGAVPAEPDLLAAVRAGDMAALKDLRTPRVRWSEHGLQVLAVKGIDPVVQLATLEELLTAVSFDAIIEGPRSGAHVAATDGGGRMVVSMTDELQRALAQRSGNDFESIAAAWVQTEEFSPHDDAGILAHFLRELAGLAHDALDRGDRLYCWVCL